MNADRSTSGVRGSTLADLLIATVMFGIIVTIAIRGWRDMSASTLSLRDRARAVANLRMAVEHLSLDLGAAKKAEPKGDDDQLKIQREKAFATLLGMDKGKDKGVVYRLRGGNLVRKDKGLKTEAVVARGLTEFLVETNEADETVILLRAGQGLGERSVTLVWLP